MTKLSACPQCEFDFRKISQDLGEELSFCPKCKLPQIEVAGKYQLQKVIGKGAFGTAYLAKHTRLVIDPERVIKVLPPDIFSIQGVSERFFREVQVTSILSQENNHIVRVYDDFGELPNNLGHFYVMEYLRGKELTDYFKDSDNLPELDFCMDIFFQLCDAMLHAHRMEVLHRDLKPANIFIIDRKGANFVKVLDFGIARPMNNNELKVTGLTQGALGTAFYMSPEQFSNVDVGLQSDIYSMGIILFEMLIGYTPYNNPNFKMTEVEIMMAKMMQEPPNPHRLKPERVSPQLAQVVLKSIASEPEDRYASVEELREAVEQALAGEENFSISLDNLGMATQEELDSATGIMDDTQHQIDSMEVHRAIATQEELDQKSDENKADLGEFNTQDFDEITALDSFDDDDDDDETTLKSSDTSAKEKVAADDTIMEMDFSLIQAELDRRKNEES